MFEPAIGSGTFSLRSYPSSRTSRESPEVMARHVGALTILASDQRVQICVKQIVVECDSALHFHSYIIPYLSDSGAMADVDLKRPQEFTLRPKLEQPGLAQHVFSCSCRP
jgi:hypothetical protein